jgi:DHA1 family tetracycline resistance protein-like MFS transporter
MNNNDSPEQLDFKRILPIIFIIFVDLMGLTMIIPVLPYYALSYDAGPVIIGLLGASYPLMQLFGGAVLSSLSDRYGRKPVLATAQVGTFLSLLLLGFSNALWMVFLARILDGITGANFPTVQAAISDSTTPKTRSQGLGLVGAAFGMGFIFGPMLSGMTLVLSGNNYSAPAFVASGFALLSIILTTFVFKETLPPEKRGQSTTQSHALSFKRISAGIRHPATGILLILLLIQQIVFGAFQIMFAPYLLMKLGLNSVGSTVAFVFIGLILVVVQGGLIRGLTERYGERQLVIAGLALLAIGLFLITLTPNQTVPWYSRADVITELQQQSASGGDLAQIDFLPSDTNSGFVGLLVLLLAISPISFGLGLLQPSTNSLLTQRTDPTQVGAILGLSSAFLSLGNIIGPLWGGVAFDYIAPTAPFLIGSIITGLLVLLAIRRL